jgi:4,5-dihydroxyphthalate decarboxylase
MSKLKITIATTDSDRVRAIVDGRVQVEGCDVNYLLLTPEELFAGVATGAGPEVSEIGFSTYLTGISRGSHPYVALPIFLSRMFRHSAIYIRTDRGIEQPADLHGRTLGVPEWQMAAALWARGMLVDDFGVELDRINWRQGGLIDPGRYEKFPCNYPDGFPIEPIGPEDTLDEMLRDGRIDGIVTARTPPCYHDDEVPVRRLFEDYEAAEKDYFQRTRVLPIMHSLAVRRDVHEANPWLAPALFKAYSESNRLSQRDLFDTAALHVSLPWIVGAAREWRDMYGSSDFWPYGVAPNRHSLETMIRYSVDQFMSVRTLEVEELFPASVLQKAPH